MHLLIHKSNNIICVLNMRYAMNVTIFVKEYLQRRGPVTVSQAGQRFFSGQDVPLRPFPCPRHPLTRPVHWSWTEQQLYSSRRQNSYLTLYSLSLPVTETNRNRLKSTLQTCQVTTKTPLQAWGRNG